MSLTNGEMQNLENAVADFDTFLAARDWKNCDVILDNLFELGYKKEAVTLGRQLLSAKMSIRPRREISRDFADKIDSHIYSQHD